ncbi:maltoporin LamB [Vibrio aestuarianus]|uniref:Maltoporin LamB n=1 Tax=Vibrio aestuarianus TaxID=28171 RepID=A0A9X4EVZ7_9VIBR|nr:maltoporin LamB [Vibrio aestuarianus]MDE1241338.1 maltoporin LamB [Vibrio aestuarianus]
MKKVSVIAAAVAATLSASAFAASVDFHGYARGGVGLSGEGSHVTYEKNKVGRLGNEDDLYAEIGLNAELYNKDDVTFNLETLVAYGQAGNNNWEGNANALRVMNVQAKGLFSDKDAVLWAGQRYYQRKDIHITDFYFLDTSGGAGGGIENLSLGDNVKASFAIMHDDGSQKVADGFQSQLTTAGAKAFADCKGDKACEIGVEGNASNYETVAKTKDETVSGYTFDARFAGIKLTDNTNLELALAYDFASEGKGQNVKADDGLLLTAVFGTGLSNGFNQTVLQYGTNSYGKQMATYGGGGWYNRSGDNNDADGFRIINWGVTGLGDSWELGHVVMYAQASDTDEGDITAYNAVIRPMYKWDENMKTIIEAGYFADETKLSGTTTDAAGSKLTIAQAWSAGSSFWARPEIRIYGSYFMDHEGDSFKDSTADSEFSVGIQMEAWW